MKALLWIIAAIAVAVGLVAAAVRSSAGYVQVVLPPYRVELSLVLALLLLAAVFAAAYLGARLVSAMIGMPRQVREYRDARRSRKASDALNDALLAFFSGRYARAEKAAADALQLGEQPGLAAILAARAAHELRAPQRRDGYLARYAEATQNSPPADSALLKAITEADLWLKEHRAAEALSVLQALPHQHTAGLRLALHALQLTQAWEASLAVIDQLEKRHVYDAAQATGLRRAALVAHLEQRATDLPTLDDAWRKVSDAMRRDARVAAAAARGYIALQAGDRAAAIIERCLDHQWDSALAALYGDCTHVTNSANVTNSDDVTNSDNVTNSAVGTPQIERAERWLTAQADDAPLLLTLGRLCAREKRWGKARHYLDASLSVEPTVQAHLACVALHEALGDADTAQRHTRAALTLAVARLAHVVPA